MNCNNLSGSMVTSVYWNDQYNILAGTQDSHLVVWYYPDIVFSDKDLLQYTCVDKQNRFISYVWLHYRY